MLVFFRTQGSSVQRNQVAFLDIHRKKLKKARLFSDGAPDGIASGARTRLCEKRHKKRHSKLKENYQRDLFTRTKTAEARTRILAF